jgi:uncharacterized RDD family membrane protein YckC
MPETTDEEGVYFRREDYAGVWRRLLIEVIDFVVAFAVSFALTVVLLAVFMPSEPESQEFRDRLTWILVIVWPTVWFVYFVILKRTRIRTLGYLIGRARIVNLQGKAPGLFPLTIRLAFATIGPINVIIDLFWITGDENRQALRDKFAGTYVINRDAEPLGRGKILYRNYLMFFNFLVREVQRPGSATTPG